MTVALDPASATNPSSLRLDGCRPEPLGAYLRAVGVLRLVGEQADATAAGWWAGEAFHLATTLDREALVRFFLERYRPTPLVSPWNKGSGFKQEKKPAAVAALGAIESSTDDRLAAYRVAIAVARAVYDEAQARAWSKSEVVEACRGRLSDEACDWIDATVVLAGDKPSYPPLLGTGGNDGRFDFSVAFMARLADVLGLASARRSPKRSTSRAWLEAALFDHPGVPLLGEAVGQFHPGGAGGINSSPFGRGPSLVNPWGWVLLIEGALLFASAAARRLRAGAASLAAVPFAVRTSPVGYTSASGEESSRGEVWAPLWERPATAVELAHLVGEGRSEWRQEAARSGLDMARAAASLGVDRGIAAFVRHSLVVRNGRYALAVPVGRIRVVARPEVPVVGQLDRWLDTVRRGRERPAAVEATLRRVDNRLYDLAARGGRDRLVEVLCAAAELEASVGRANRFRHDAGVPPAQWLSAAEWLAHLDDGSPELRLAAALASMRDPLPVARGGDASADGRGDGGGQSLRALLRPVVRKGRQWEWSPASAPVAGFRVRPLAPVLAAAHARRVIDVAVSRAVSRSDGEERTVGVPTAFRLRLTAPLPAVARFVAGDLDEDRLGRLLAAMLLLDWWPLPAVGHWYDDSWSGQVEPLVPSWWLLAPFFCGREVQLDEPGSPSRGVCLDPEASWPALLEADHTAVVASAAVRRLRMARLRPRLTDASAVLLSGPTSPRGPRLGAALLCPIGPGAAARLLGRVARSGNEDDNSPPMEKEAHP